MVFFYLQNYDGVMSITYKGVRMMIEKIVAKLLLLYPEVNGNDLKIEQLEYDGKSYEISDEVKGMPFLFLMLNNKGRLDSFSLETDYFGDDKVLSREEVLIKSTKLIDLFIDEERESLHLSSVMDMDEQWWIEFARKDPYLGMELPNSGASIRIKKNGVIVSANIEIENFQVEEPKLMTSAEEAKALFLERIALTPAIMRFNTDYIGGDDAYHFVYYVEMAVETNSELDTIEGLGGNLAQYEKLSPVQNTSKELYEIIGIPTDFVKISDGQTGDGRLEVWGNKLSSDSEFEEVDVLEIYFDEKNRVSWLRGVPDEIEKNLFNKSAEEAYERAIEFLHCQYADAAERFHLLREEHELLFYDEERETEVVDAYQFNFQQFERGVIVEGATISFEIDSRSLTIRTVYAEAEIQIDLSTIIVDCTFPIEKAKEIYANALEMETFWSKEIDEDLVTYRLAYLPGFPATIGHMRAIDAKTGQPWFIDTSYMEEFES